VVNNYEQELAFASVATCKSFRVEAPPAPPQVASPREADLSAAPFSLAAGLAASGSSTPGTNPSTPGGPLARGLGSGSGSGSGLASFNSRVARAGALMQQQQQQQRTLMVFDGCTRGLAATVLLRGADLAELAKLKRVVSFAALAAYHLRIENIFLAEELTAATSSGVADGGRLRLASLLPKGAWRLSVRAAAGGSQGTLAALLLGQQPWPAQQASYRRVPCATHACSTPFATRRRLLQTWTPLTGCCSATWPRWRSRPRQTRRPLAGAAPWWVPPRCWRHSAPLLLPAALLHRAGPALQRCARRRPRGGRRAAAPEPSAQAPPPPQVGAMSPHMCRWEGSLLEGAAVRNPSDGSVFSPPGVGTQRWRPPRP
jgi:hypothetical protein